jgi:hypothetical protein
LLEHTAEAISRGTLAPGTYRRRDGLLVHCWPAEGEGVRVEIERAGAGHRASRLLRAGELVKLSDDPGWPDLEIRAALGACD